MSLVISFVIFAVIAAILYFLLAWALPKLGVSGKAYNIIMVIFVVLVVLAFIGTVMGYVPRIY